MNSSVRTYCAETGTLVLLEAAVFREQLQRELRTGARVVTLYGRREHDAAVITAVLQGKDYALHVLRAQVAVSTGYHELTSEWPALQCFERELHEQTGMRIADHPWLKPIRYQGQDQAALDAYPYYRVEGKQVHEVAVGPIHAGVIEPGAFRFMCLGEQVHHLEIQLGYQHRGVERLLLRSDPRALAPLIETIAGDSSVAHSLAYCSALERLAGWTPSLATDAVRMVMLELERVAMHLATLSGLATDLGFLQGAAAYGRLRTTAINTMLQICGSRFGRGAIRPAGVAARASPDLHHQMDVLREELALIGRHFLGARSVQHRLRAVGVLTTTDADALGMVGLVARASGLPIDARLGAQHGAFRLLPPSELHEDSGDCWARSRQRVREIDASLTWLSTVLAMFPCSDARRSELGQLAPHQLSISVVEGVRGEVVHALETGERGELVHYKVQDPSLRNWLGLAIAMRNNEISDFPICNKSFDLSYCGHDL